MSVHISSPVWKKSSASGNNRLVLLYLADCANDDGACWPSIAAIARNCNISEATVHRSIAWLKNQAKELTIEAGKGPRGVNLYTIDPDKLGSQIETPPKLRPLPPPKLRPKPSVEPSVVLDAHASAPEPKMKSPSSPEQAVVMAYCETAGINQPANYDRAIGQAKKLIALGVTVDDIPDLFAAANWGDGPDLGKMLISVDRWRARKVHAPKVPVDQLPPPLKKRYDSVVQERTSERREILPLPPDLQRDIDDWKRSQSV